MRKAWRWNSKSIASSKPALCARLTERLIAARAPAGPAARRPASEAAEASSSSAGTTRLTSPSRSASSAGSGSPVKNISRALPLPISRGRSQVAPPSAVRPIFTKASTNAAAGTASRMSQAIAMLAPIPAATPFMAAITGLGMERSRVRMPWYSSLIASSDPSLVPNSPTSAPAQKARPLPMTTTQRTASSFSTCFRAASSCLRRSPLTAFIRSGRLSRTQPTRSRTSTRTTCSTAWVTSTSPSFERGLSLLEESAHALFLVFGSEQEVEVLALDQQPFVERGLERLVDGLLGQPDRQRRLLGQLPRQLLGNVHGDLRRHHAVDEPKLVGPVRRERLACQVDLHRDVLADRPRPALGPAGA